MLIGLYLKIKIMELKEVKIEDLKHNDKVLIEKDGEFFLSIYYENKYFICSSATYNDRDIDNNEVGKIYLLK
jgi:hypothetical protein